jgi:hypothetical protein
MSRIAQSARTTRIARSRWEMSMSAAARYRREAVNARDDLARTVATYCARRMLERARACRVEA